MRAGYRHQRLRPRIEAHIAWLELDDLDEGLRRKSRVAISCRLGESDGSHAAGGRRPGGRGSLRQWHPRGKRAVWGGRSRVRGALYMGTLRTRYNPVICDFYQMAAGGPEEGGPRRV